MSPARTTPRTRSAIAWELPPIYCARRKPAGGIRMSAVRLPMTATVRCVGARAARRSGEISGSVLLCAFLASVPPCEPRLHAVGARGHLLCVRCAVPRCADTSRGTPPRGTANDILDRPGSDLPGRLASLVVGGGQQVTAEWANDGRDPLRGLMPILRSLGLLVSFHIALHLGPKPGRCISWADVPASAQLSYVATLLVAWCETLRPQVVSRTPLFLSTPRLYGTRLPESFCQNVLDFLASHLRV